MGCSSSKNNLPSEPTLVSGTKPADIQPEISCEDPPPQPEQEPEPEPPAAPVVCGAYVLDSSADTCLSCPAGWRMLTAKDGKKAGTPYFFAETGTSQWARPSGTAKEEAEATCTCGRLKSAHVVCDDCDPQLATDPITCACGFPKEMHKPCSHYRVNMSAANFGDCKCGFGKDEHSAAAFSKAAKKELVKKGSAELRGEMVQKQYADCPKYCVNLESGNFGECMCGRPKAEHSPEALAKNAIAGQTAGTTRRDADEVKSKFVQKQKVTCLRYSPNLTAGDFGVCTCGAKRADHTDAALAADTGAKSAKQQNAADVRAGMVQRVVCDCSCFALNMDPAAPFGTCTCGRPRSEHSDAALAADSAPKHLVKKGSEEVRAEMTMKQQEIGTAVETQGAKTGVAFGIGNTVRTAAEEEAAIQRGINARAGGADKAAALNEFNEMMKDAAAPAAD